MGGKPGLVATEDLGPLFIRQDSFRLTPQQVGAGVRRTVRPKQQPVKVVVLPLREVAQVGVRILFKRAAHS